jgi:hypothetical protein
MGMPVKNKLILGAIALATLVVLFIFGQEPPSGRSTRDTCPSQGIDPEVRNEGTCYVGDTKTVVVDSTHRLRLETLEAKLGGIRESTALSSPNGVRLAQGMFVTVVLAITNRTDQPETLGENQVALNLGGTVGEDEGVERAYEPHSFLAQGKAIPPGGTGHGTVTFAISDADAEVLTTEGNLDIGNFRTDGDYEPERLLQEPEVGVIRTYRKPTG